MRKEELKKWILWGVCICLGIFSVGCSSRGNEAVASVQDMEYQADKEASDTALDSIAGDSAGKAGDEERQDEQELRESEQDIEGSAEEPATQQNVKVYNYASMDNVLAAMVWTMEAGEINRYSKERSDDTLLVDYLYAYVNMFNHDTFKPVSLAGTDHDTYVKPEADYLDELLLCAFGDSISLSDLKADGSRILKDGEDYYVALDDIQPILVDYTGFENEGFTESTVFPFDYEVYLENGDTENGIMQVRFQESEETESGIVLQAVAISMD